MSLLHVENLRVNFDTSAGLLHAVREVTFDVGEGEILGIVGESGSGKSVTAHSLLRLLPGNAAEIGGNIRYRGRSVMQMDARKLRSYRGGEVGIIFQEPSRSFDPIYSVERTMAETLRAHQPGLTDTEVRRRALELLREVNVPRPEDRLSNFPHQFSGGLLQRIMIALSLASNPSVLIADEPTTALDVTIQAGIIDLLLALRRERNLSIIFITHDLALISHIADRVAVMYSGMILEEGTADDVLYSPRHPYTRALLSSLLSFGQHHSQAPIQTIPGGVPDPYHEESGCPFAPRCPLVHSECLQRVPPARFEGTTHRCLISGVKEERYAHAIQRS